MRQFLPIDLPVPLETEIRRLCERAYPYEACGAFLGTGDGIASPWRIAQVRETPNQNVDDPRRRFLISPEVQLSIEREATEHGLDVLGYFHSHPDHPAQPSEYDRTHAWFGYVYLICSVASGRSVELHAFALDHEDGHFISIPLVS